MPARFTIGIEEEFQLVDRQTGELAPAFHRIFETGHSILGEHLKPEIQQVVAELVSDIYPDVATARVETRKLRAQLVDAVTSMLIRHTVEGIAIDALHPMSRSQSVGGER